MLVMPGAEHISHLSGAFRARGPGDVTLAALADRQHGVVSLAQLRELGVSGRASRQRAANGRLHRIHQGVYAVGRRELTVRGRWMAAVLAYGPRALLGRRSAAALAEIVSWVPALVDVLVPGSSVRRRPGIRAYRTDTLAEEDATSIDGIPCTTVERTLLDLADVTDLRGLERALNQADAQRILDHSALTALLARSPGRRGSRMLRKLLAEAAEPAFPRSELEEMFFLLCRRAGVPRPLVNEPLLVDGTEMTVDFLWSDERLVVETDSRRWHSTREAFEEDRRRDQLLAVEGLRVVRFTWHQIVREPDRVTGVLASLLGAGAAPGPR